jgi:Flp pilus assembly secretin CpaC
VVLVAWIGGVLLASPAAARQLGKNTPQVLVGVSFAEIRFDSTQNLGVDWRTGFAAGVGFPLPAKKGAPVAFVPEVLLVQKGAQVVSSGVERVHLSYLQAALGIQLDVLPAISGDRRVLLTIAPTLNLNLTASNDVNGHVESLRDSVKRFEAGLMVGGTIPLVKNRLDASVRFEWAFTRLFRDPKSTAKNRELLILITPRIFRP